MVLQADGVIMFSDIFTTGRLSSIRMHGGWIRFDREVGEHSEAAVV